MRWNTRSAPVRSTRTATPGYFASNVLAMRSASGEIDRGVPDDLAFLLRGLDQRRRDRLAGGACDATWARTGAASIVADASAAAPLSVSRRVKIVVIGIPVRQRLSTPKIFV